MEREDPVERMSVKYAGRSYTASDCHSWDPIQVCCLQILTSEYAELKQVLFLNSFDLCACALKKFFGLSRVSCLLCLIKSSLCRGTRPRLY